MIDRKLRPDKLDQGHIEKKIISQEDEEKTPGIQCLHEKDQSLPRRIVLPPSGRSDCQPARSDDQTTLPFAGDDRQPGQKA